jgi:SAM-dependent methyltransferase/DNA-directed RNA polymerase subunit RPC12/RpoP
MLARVPASGRVLDLGSREGSYDARAYPFRTVRVDLDRSAGISVQADAARLPFASECFDALVSNHSLEHFTDLDGAIAEISRVVKRPGAAFIAVPDAATFTDRLYRWLARGGGHVNRFTSADKLTARIEQASGLECRGVRVLHTSLSFLNPHNRRARAPRKLLLLAGGWEPLLVALSFALRAADRAFRTRLSVYGWAFYFGCAPADASAWTNVCVRCGAGHAARDLRPGVLRFYRCPGCGARNLFTPDRV